MTGQYFGTSPVAEDAGGQFEMIALPTPFGSCESRVQMLYKVKL